MKFIEVEGDKSDDGQLKIFCRTSCEVFLSVLSRLFVSRYNFVISLWAHFNSSDCSHIYFPSEYISLEEIIKHGSVCISSSFGLSIPK